MGVIWGLCSIPDYAQGRFMYPLSSAEIASSQTKGWLVLREECQDLLMKDSGALRPYPNPRAPNGPM